MSKLAWIYVRVSSEEQGKGYSLESQESRCRDYAAQRGYTVVGVAQDLHTGEALDRQGLGGIFDAAATQPFDVLVVYDMDRFSRGGPAHCAILEAQLERHGVTIEFVLGNYNGDSPEAVLSKYIKQSISWYENQQRRERVTRGRLTAAKHGRVLTGFRAPYGYRYADGQLHIDPEEATVVRRIFDAVLEGSSARRIAEMLSADRIPTRADKNPRFSKRNATGIWHYSSVQKILRNMVYSGIWHYNKRKFTKVDGKPVAAPRRPDEWIAVIVPPLIDQETFDRAQAQLDRNRSQAKRNTKQAYLLQFLVVCACGSRCGCETDARRNMRFYTCPNRRRKAYDLPCPVRFMIKADTLEASVWRLVTETLLDPAYLQSWLATQHGVAADHRRRHAERQAAIADSLKDVERKLGALLDLALTDGFPRAVIDERKKSLLDQRRRLEHEDRQARAALATLDLSPDQEQDLLALAARVRDGIDALDFAARRKVVEMLNLQIEVIARRVVRISALLPVGAPGNAAANAGMKAAAHFAVELDLENGAMWAVGDESAPLRGGRPEQRGTS